MAERRGRPFRTLGMRMQDFGRRLMRNYVPPQSMPIAPNVTPPPSWQANIETPLNWGQQPTPVQPAAPVVPEMMPAQNPQLVDDAPEMPVIQSQAESLSAPISSDERLAAILRRHEEQDAERDQIREQKKALFSAPPEVQRAPDETTASEPPRSRPRRGSASFDYVETRTLMPADEEAKTPPSPTVQAARLPDEADDNDDDDMEESRAGEAVLPETSIPDVVQRAAVVPASPNMPAAEAASASGTTAVSRPGTPSETAGVQPAAQSSEPSPGNVAPPTIQHTSEPEQAAPPAAQSPVPTVQRVSEPQQAAQPSTSAPSIVQRTSEPQAAAQPSLEAVQPMNAALPQAGQSSQPPTNPPSTAATEPQAPIIQQTSEPEQALQPQTPTVQRSSQPTPAGQSSPPMNTMPPAAPQPEVPIIQRMNEPEQVASSAAPTVERSNQPPQTEQSSQAEFQPVSTGNPPVQRQAAPISADDSGEKSPGNLEGGSASARQNVAVQPDQPAASTTVEPSLPLQRKTAALASSEAGQGKSAPGDAPQKPQTASVTPSESIQSPVETAATPIQRETAPPSAAAQPPADKPDVQRRPEMPAANPPKAEPAAVEKSSTTPDIQRTETVAEPAISPPEAAIKQVSAPAAPEPKSSPAAPSSAKTPEAASPIQRQIETPPTSGNPSVRLPEAPGETQASVRRPVVEPSSSPSQDSPSAADTQKPPSVQSVSPADTTVSSRVAESSVRPAPPISVQRQADEVTGAPTASQPIEPPRETSIPAEQPSQSPIQRQIERAPQETAAEPPQAEGSAQYAPTEPPAETAKPGNVAKPVSTPTPQPTAQRQVEPPAAKVDKPAEPKGVETPSVTERGENIQRTAETVQPSTTPDSPAASPAPQQTPPGETAQAATVSPPAMPAASIARKPDIVAAQPPTPAAQPEAANTLPESAAPQPVDVFEALAAAGMVSKAPDSPPAPSVARKPDNGAPKAPTSIAPSSAEATEGAETSSASEQQADVYQALVTAGMVPSETGIIARKAERLPISNSEADLLRLLESTARRSETTPIVQRAPPQPPLVPNVSQPAPFNSVMREIPDSSSNDQPSAETEAQNGDVDVDKIARDVYSLLRNRLRIERERRS